jgi:cysteine-rich repeat protein
VACHQPTCGDGIQDNWFVPNPAGVSGAPGAGGASSTGGASGAGGAGPGGTYYSEECDDLNAVSGDGCSSECVIESGWLCPTPGTACHQPGCGNGFIDFTAGGAPGSSGASSTGGAGPLGTTEQCDDLNTVSGDGCSAQCTIEPGFACEVPGACHLAVCGNGVVEWPAEQCDDGNQIANDGCNQCVYQYSGGSGGAGNAAAGASGH